MQQFGLIGKTLTHSHSPFLHEMLGDSPYTLFPLDENDFPSFMENRRFDGVNVTIPYKQAVIPYCSHLDETAREIGAVNTLVNLNGALHGYNTDAEGFALLLSSLPQSIKGKTALILGNGGTSCTARYVLARMGAGPIWVATRNPSKDLLSYDEAQNKSDVQLLINTTPVGMYPNNGQLPLSLDSFPNLEAVVDVVYNPAKTALVLAAEKRGIPAVGGLAMLAEQARAASSLFLQKEQAPQHTQALYIALQEKLCNIVLLGMPGCGKSSLGQRLAQSLGHTFVDLDTLIEQQENRTPKNIIEKEGENTFRNIESRVVQQAGKEHGQIIATGGGVVLREENIDALRQNGVLIWIDCPLASLSLNGNRPLSRNLDDLYTLDKQRRPLYKAACDVQFQRPDDFTESLSRLTALVKQLFHHSLNTQFFMPHY